MKLIQTHFEKMAAFWGGFDQQRGYDLRGRKKSLSDPDTGSYFYDYNAFGELITQTDGNGNLTSTRYDRLGRVSRRDSGVDLISEYGYDNCTKGIGKLCVVTAKGIATPSGTGASVGHQRTLTYDVKGRLQAEETRVATGVAGAMDPSARVYTASTLFDAAGRVREIRYPNGQFVTRHYDAAGAWSKLTASSGKVLWQGAMPMPVRATVILTSVPRKRRPHSGSWKRASIGSAPDLVWSLEFRHLVKSESASTIGERFNWQYALIGGSPKVATNAPMSFVPGKSRPSANARLAIPPS